MLQVLTEQKGNGIYWLYYWWRFSENAVLARQTRICTEVSWRPSSQKIYSNVSKSETQMPCGKKHPCMLRNRVASENGVIGLFVLSPHSTVIRYTCCFGCVPYSAGLFGNNAHIPVTPFSVWTFSLSQMSKRELASFLPWRENVRESEPKNPPTPPRAGSRAPGEPPRRRRSVAS